MRDLQSLRNLADAGDPAALFELGARSLLGRGAPRAPNDGLGWIEAAASKGHPPALSFRAVLFAAGLFGEVDWELARELLVRAALLGDRDALDQQELLGWPEAEVGCLCKPPQPDEVLHAPKRAIVRGFIPALWCDWIVNKATPRLRSTSVYGADAPVVENRRTNSGAGFHLQDTDLVIQATRARAAAALGLPLSWLEPTNVLHYAPGQEFKPHVDFLDGVGEFSKAGLREKGQRIQTLLIYLNDDYDAGETHFPLCDWSFRGKKGDALMFSNVTSEGALDGKSLHAGVAPTRGEKWVLSQWARDRPQSLL